MRASQDRRAHQTLRRRPRVIAGFNLFLRRRTVSISRTYLALVIGLTLAPLLFLLASAVDVIRQRRAVTLRLLVFCLWYLTIEAGMLPLLLLSWLRFRKERERLLADTARLQEAFAGSLFGALRRLFQLRLVVVNAAIAQRGPVIVLARHTSMADTLLPTVLLSRDLGLRLRFVLKHELLADPCLDIAGNRLPNLFVTRNRARTETDLAGIRQLASGMTADEGLLIYPEGTRFSPGKQAHALEQLRKTSEREWAIAAEWRHVMPPKPGGVLAALAGAPAADVVWLAHSGLEGLADLRAIWSGNLVGKTLRVALWRTPRQEIPTTAEAQRRWLLDGWGAMERWAADQDG